MSKKSKWHVGQQITIVLRAWCGQYAPVTKSATVTKAGRRWVTIDDHPTHPSRFDANTGYFDGGEYTDSRVAYASLDEYRATQAKDDAWRQLKSAAWGGTPPSWLSLDEIEDMVRRLHGGPKGIV